MQVKKAEWIIDLDIWNDAIYERPGCPECDAPVVDIEGNGKYVCLSCAKEYELTTEMVEWFKEREGMKTELEDCFHCGGKKTIEVHYRKNDNTLEWQATGGECKQCGLSFIV